MFLFQLTVRFSPRQPGQYSQHWEIKSQSGGGATLSQYCCRLELVGQVGTQTQIHILYLFYIHIDVSSTRFIRGLICGMIQVFLHWHM